MISQPFGKLDDNREVNIFTLINKNGLKVTISNFGGVVTSLFVPDRNGKLEDVVLGYDTLMEYQQDKAYFGGIIGRYANRIAKGKFTLEGKEYQVTVNGENHMHGGNVGFNKVLWEVTKITESPEELLELSYISVDGEEGFPGTLTLKVIYTLTNQNELRIDYVGTTDKTTILNPTNHSYFNLSGSFTNTILNHILTIDADAITPIDNNLIPTAKLLDVTNTPMDFRSPTEVGKRINDDFEQLSFGGGYDHNWVLRNYDGNVRKVAELYEKTSGRLMTVYTDQPGLQFYSGNFVGGKGKGVSYMKRTALCLEAECFPDSPNRPDFPSVELKPEQTYRQTTIYRFSIKIKNN